MEVAADIKEVDRSFESVESKEIDDEKHYNDESDGEPPTD